jgi:hypothetical protein
MILINILIIWLTKQIMPKIIYNRLRRFSNLKNKDNFKLINKITIYITTINMSNTDYTFTDTLRSKTFIPDIFGIYLNSDGTIYKILSNIEGAKLKKNSLGTFLFTIKKELFFNYCNRR